MTPGELIDWRWSSNLTFHYLEVQQFAVWDKDAKDESGSVGYYYLDPFPCGEAPSLIRICPR